MGQQDPQQHIDQLSKTLGFDVTKTNRITSDALTQAAAELAEENLAKAKDKAKELLVKAQDLVGKMNEAEKKFRQEHGKAGKELAKLMGQINNVSQGKPADEPVEDAAPEAETPAE